MQSNKDDARSGGASIPALSDLVVATSLLTKAIRRGDTELAGAAAEILAADAIHRLMRSLTRTAVSEIGLANLPLVECTLQYVEAGAKAWRHFELMELVERLAVSPKCHAAADLMSIARDSPMVSLMRQYVIDKSARDRVAVSLCRDHSLEERAVAARFLAPGPRGEDLCRTSRRDCQTFHDLLRLVAKEGRTQPAERAFRLDRSEAAIGLGLLLACPEEPLELMPLAEGNETSTVGGAPSYAFDEHTLVGAWALTLAAKNDPEIKLWLKHAVRWWEHRIEALAFLLYAVEGKVTGHWCPTPTAARLERRRASGHRSIRRQLVNDGIELMYFKIGVIDKLRHFAYDNRFDLAANYRQHKFSGPPGSSSPKKFGDE